MFFRVKPAGTYRYLQIAHSVREGKKVRQQVIATLGIFAYPRKKVAIFAQPLKKVKFVVLRTDWWRCTTA